MIHIWHTVIDSIFPPSPAGLIIRQHTEPHLTRYYTPIRVDTVLALSHYHTPLIAACIGTAKFEKNFHSITLLSTLLHHHLATLPPKPTILIPVPLSAARQRERGYNQVAEVCHQLPALPYPIRVLPLLMRTKHTAPQTSLDRAHRLRNVTDAFAVQTRHLRQPLAPRYIICDDVVTTGATIAAAVATLRPHLLPQTDLTCIAWAH